MESKIGEEAQQLLDKFKEMRKLEKERDKVQEELKEMNIKVCRVQNEMEEIINSNTMRF